MFKIYLLNFCMRFVFQNRPSSRRISVQCVSYLFLLSILRGYIRFQLFYANVQCQYRKQCPLCAVIQKIKIWRSLPLMGVDGHVNQTEAVAFDFSLTCNFNLF